MTMLLAVGVICTVAGVLIWPSPWADPRRVAWHERGRAGHGHAGHGRADAAPAHEVAVVAQLIAIALQTGLPVGSAVERACGHCSAELRRDLLPVVSAYERGSEPEVAWSGVPDVWQPIASALVVAGRAGIAPGSLLRTASSAGLRRESVLRESAIGRVSVRLVLPLGAVLLPAFMCTTVIPLVVVMTRGFLGT